MTLVHKMPAPNGNVKGNMAGFDFQIVAMASPGRANILAKFDKETVLDYIKRQTTGQQGVRIASPTWSLGSSLSRMGGWPGNG